MSAIVLLLGLASAPPSLAAGAAPEITVYAAASLKDALEAVAPACERATGADLVFNFGASSALAKQIQAAGKADVFFSADEAWMDTIAKEGHVDTASRTSPLSNRLVVVGPADGGLKVGSGADLRGEGVKRLCLADPAAVPAGKYAKEWLTGAGAWDGVADRVVPALDVRAALAAVEAGACEAGIVYGTDAAMSKKAKVLHEVPDAEGPKISYAIAALAERPRLVLARTVVACLVGSEADAVYVRMGFVVK
jgi:molybdate transport system substrate-binding protein